MRLFKGVSKNEWNLSWGRWLRVLGIKVLSLSFGGLGCLGLWLDAPGWLQ